MNSQPKRKKSEDWPVSVGRGYAEEVASDYQFNSPKVRSIYRKQFMHSFKLEIANGFLRSTSYDDMDEFRLGMAETLGWDWENTTGWRKLTGFGKQGSKGPKNPMPPFEDMMIYVIVKKLWQDVSFSKCVFSAIRSSLLDISRHMENIDSTRKTGQSRELPVCDRSNVTVGQVECLRYSFGHKKILLENFKPFYSFEVHMKENIGHHYAGKEVNSILADLRNLAATWLEPWALMELALPYRWINWGYYQNETKHEV